ncbi:unnamed protein product [Spodoptera exigua]|nr:unnamed protein product [Spodoptera exigua]
MEPVKVAKNSQKGQSQQPEPSTSTGSGTSRPRRGRPSGANRVPLTLEERRARNAQYERERREDFAAAQAELAEAAGCDPNASTINLMFVVTKLKKASEDFSIEEYQRINANLEAQIASCFERLGPEFVLSGDEDDVEIDDSNTRKRKLSQETSRDEKRMRPGPEQVPVSGSGPMVSTTDLAEAGPFFPGTHSQLPSSFFPSPNSPDAELPTPSQFAHQTPSPLLQQETALEQEIALRFCKKYEKEVNLKDNIFRQPGDDQSQLAAPVHEHDTYTSTTQLNHIIGNWAIQCPCHRQ